MLVCLVLCRNLNRLDNIHMFRRALRNLAVLQVHKLNVQSFEDFLAKKDKTCPWLTSLQPTSYFGRLSLSSRRSGLLRKN